MLLLSPLKKAKKKPTLKKILVADIETDKNGYLLDIGFYDGDNYETFTNWHDFLDFLPENSKVWFHNGGRFDCVNALSELSESTEWSAGISGSAIVRLEFLEKKIVFADSFMIFQSSLAAISKAFNCQQKMELNIEYKDMRQFRTDNPTQYYKYLYIDCLSLYQCLYEFSYLINDKFHIAELPLTIASLALKIWRSNYLDTSIVLPDEPRDKFIRNGYYGGRVQYLGCGVMTNGVYKNCKILDVNSMYPKAMLGELPIGALFYSKDFKKVCKDNKNKIPFGMYRVSYTLPKSLKHSPFISYKDGTSYVFSHVATDTYLTHEDLELITKLKGRYDVKEFYYTLETAPIFERYVLENYDLKAKAQNPVERLLAKYLLNCLYGKLGQKLIRRAVYNAYIDGEMANDFNETIDNDYKNNKNAACKLLSAILYDDAENNANVEILSFLPDSLIFAVDEITPIARRISNPLIAAYVTARARRMLWQELERHDAIYCDTDSLITQSEFTGNYHETELGAWSYDSDKKTGIVFDDVDVQIRGRKNYTVFKNGQVLKSVHKGVSKFVTDDSKNIHKNVRVGYSLSPTGFKTWARQADTLKNPSQFKVKKRRLTKQEPTK